MSWLLFILTLERVGAVSESILLAQIKSPESLLYFAIKILPTVEPFTFGVVITKSVFEGSKSTLPKVCPDKINSLLVLINE